MDSEVEENSIHEKATYTDIFNDMLPYFLSIGVTVHDFWYGDLDIPKWYLEAEEIKNQKKNQELWLQGLYIYEAISVVHFNLNRDKNTNPIEYPSEPYKFNEEKEENVRDKEQQKLMAQQYMSQLERTIERMKK